MSRPSKTRSLGAGSETLAVLVSSALAEATGREHRRNPVLARTGGPAGNAVLTAWVALALLVASVGELLTLFDVRWLITWHVAMGAILVPPALVKTGSTGWRMARYYLGSPPYRAAGPPPLLLRVLGPFVVVATLGLLGTGVLLVVLGAEASHHPLLTVVGFQVDWVSLHQGFFAVWGVVTGLHVLGRVVPALRPTVGPARGENVPGAWTRWLLLGATALAAAALAVVLVHADGSWASFHPFFDDGRGPGDG
jgi:hypothetical protein